MSAGGDGKILIWRLSQSSKHLKLLTGFVVQTDNIPRNLRVSKARGDSMVGGNNARTITLILYLSMMKTMMIDNK